MKSQKLLKLGLPKGSLQESTLKLFRKAGYHISVSSRSYYPVFTDTEISSMLIRAQEMARYVESGVLDCGLTGYDWIMEQGADVKEVAELNYAKEGLRPVSWVVAVPNDSKIKSLKDLDGKKVSVQVGTKSVSFLKDNYPKVERVEVEKNQEMFSLVEIGRADAAVTGKPAAKIFAQAKPSLHVLAEQLTTEDYGIAVRKDAPEIRDAVNAALKKIKADGTYDKLVNKWFEAGK